MMSDSERYRNELKSLPLFASLNDQELSQLLGITREISLQPHEILIEEGHVSHEMYVLLEGEMVISKKGHPFYFKGVLKEIKHKISHLKSGDIIGEIGLFDQSARSATVESVTKANLIAIPYQALRQLADANANFNKFLLGLSQNVCKNLRHTNEVVVHALENNISEYNMRLSMSMFVMQIIVAFSLLSFLLSGLNFLGHSVSLTTYITIPMTLFYLVLIFLLVRSSHLPWRMFGLTTKNWQQSLIDIAKTLPIFLILIVLVKILLINTVPGYIGKPLFEPFKDVETLASSSNYSPIQLWCIVMLSYWFLTAPIQELIVRGGLQGCLEYFLVAKNKTFQAILISNMIFSTMHLFISFEVTVMVFFGGLYFGWLYSRTKTLIGVTLAHAILGTWLLGVVGV